MNYKAVIVTLLRLAFGWLFLYAGLTKVFDSTWSSAGYLKGAKTFPAFYEFLLRPEILPFVDFINEWGLTLLGASLVLGILVRLSAPLGALLMILYYLPILDFPYVGSNSFLVDQHLIFALALLLLAELNAGKYWGLDALRK